MHLVLGVGVGGLNFNDQSYENKPWRNGERLSVKNFNDKKSIWYKTWTDSSKLQVDYVRVIAL